jgi:diamine N-acetyltransferase
MIIRLATLADAQNLAAFGDKTFFDTFGHLYPHGDADFFSRQRFSLERTQADISEEGRYIQLAFEGDVLKGFLDCGPLGLPVEAATVPSLELYRLYVDIAAKGTGLAHELMKMAIDWARARHGTSLYLGVYHDNMRAQAFYKKYGFEIIGAYQFRVGNTLDDERIMELKLS